VRVLSLIHQDDARAGVFADAVTASGAALEEASLALGRPPTRPPHEYDAVMVFGGSMNVDEAAEHPWLDDERALIGELIRRERPLLGVCLGSQLVAEVAGAEVGRMPGGAEIGWHDVERLPGSDGDPVIGALPRRFLAFEWHSYGAATPPGAVELARNARGLQAFRLDGAPAWGIQFHAEVDAPTLAGWVENDARDEGVDPDELTRRSRGELERWNALGRTLCGAFIAAAADR
jgi:GMP synthase-like glutamine amidotransferase